MRTSMKIASGVLAVVVDPITAKYDAILATNPTVPVLFQLPEYRGQQVLFTDAAATDPVTEVGDPIGGVRHPLTGEIVAVQTTDADRPEWGGFELGAVFPLDPSNKLFAQASTSDSQPHSIFAAARRSEQVDSETWLWRGDDSATVSNAFFLSSSDVFRIRTSGVAMATITAPPSDNFRIFGGIYDQPATVIANSDSETEDIGPPATSVSEWVIGGRDDRGDRGANQDWRHWLFYDRAVSEGTVELLEELL